MPSCALRYCKSRYGKQIEQNLSLFTFPSGDVETQDIWVQFVRVERSEENWLPSSASKLCSKHFKGENMNRGKTGRIMLKKGSIPCTTIENQVTNSVTVKATQLGVVESDSGSTFDSSRKAALKIYQAPRLEQQNRHYQITIKKLGRQNKYLKNKILCLKDSVRHLQKSLIFKKTSLNHLKRV